MKHSIIKTHQPVEELSFVIAPPPHIKSDVSVLKDDVQFLTGKLFEDRHTPSHISLFRYDDKQHFDDILREVESKAATFDPFNIFVKGLKFHWMHGNRSIYLDILNKPDVREVFGKLVKENTGYVPFISVAKGLDHNSFMKAWLHLQDLRYAQDFLCDRVTVLARKGNIWLRYKEIMFNQS
jgi:hypothetical protein